MSGKETVLFLCTSNSCRRQMAEAYLRKYAGDRLDVYSAGLNPTEIHPMTRQVMAESGLDLRGQYAKGVRMYLGQFFVHYLVIVCARANENCPKIWPAVGRRFFWPFDDPASLQETTMRGSQSFDASGTSSKHECLTGWKTWSRKRSPQI